MPVNTRAPLALRFVFPPPVLRVAPTWEQMLDQVHRGLRHHPGLADPEAVVRVSGHSRAVWATLDRRGHEITAKIEDPAWWLPFTRQRAEALVQQLAEELDDRECALTDFELANTWAHLTYPDTRPDRNENRPHIVVGGCLPRSIRDLDRQRGRGNGDR